MMLFDVNVIVTKMFVCTDPDGRAYQPTRARARASVTIPDTTPLVALYVQELHSHFSGGSEWSPRSPGTGKTPRTQLWTCCLVL